MPALLLQQGPGRGQAGNCEFILMDGPMLMEDWHAGEPLVLPVMHLMKDKFVFI